MGCDCKSKSNYYIPTMRDIKGKAIVAGVAGGSTLAFSIVGVTGVITNTMESRLTSLLAAPAVTFVSVLAAEFIMDYVKI